MPHIVRKMSPDDARAFLEVHHAAVHGIATKDYPPAVIEEWARLPITDAAIQIVRSNPDNEYRLIAEANKQIVGIGALVVENSELRACYVAPEASRKGIGSALVHEIERVALAQGLTHLELDSSVSAEHFYASLGYEILERSEHLLPSGQAMACVKMRKKLSPSR